MRTPFSRISWSTPTLGTIDRFRRFAGFPPFWALLKRSSARCTLCHDNHMERAMTLYGQNGDKSNSLPWLCYLEVLAYQSLFEMVRVWLGVDRSVFKRFLSETPTRYLIANYLRGFCQFGAVTPQPSGAPVILVWEITRSCNLHCVYCHVDAGQTPMNNELTRSEKLELVQQVAEAGTNALMIAGGEPLTSPDLPEMLHEAHQRGLYTVLITNGTLLSRENALCLNSLVWTTLKSVSTQFVRKSMIRSAGRDAGKRPLRGFEMPWMPGLTREYLSQPPKPISGRSRRSFEWPRN
jgi:uncharacterized radical SAM superfamily Fe-S cluster-containing enzyme